MTNFQILPIAKDELRSFLPGFLCPLLITPHESSGPVLHSTSLPNHCKTSVFSNPLQFRIPRTLCTNHCFFLSSCLNPSNALSERLSWPYYATVKTSVCSMHPLQERSALVLSANCDSSSPPLLHRVDHRISSSYFIRITSNLWCLTLWKMGCL